MKHIIVMILMGCFFSSYGKEILVFTPNAWEEYAKGIEMERIEVWLDKGRYQYQILSGEWQPKTHELHWIYYRYLDFRIWFLVPENTFYRDYHQFRKTLLTVPRIKEHRDKISIRKVKFRAGTIVKPSSLMMEVNVQEHLMETKKEWEADILEQLSKVERQLVAAMQNDGLANLSPKREKDYWEKAVKDLNNQQFKMPINQQALSKMQAMRKKFGIDKLFNNQQFSTEEFVKDWAANVQKGQATNAKDGIGNTGTPSGEGQPRKGSTGTTSSNSNSASEGESDASNGSGGSGGIGGPVPMKTSFSKWFQLAAREILKYYGLEGLSNQALFLAYMLAPDLMEEVGDFFAKIQDLASIKDLDEFLDAAADLYMKLDKYMKYAWAAYNLLSSPDLEELADNIDWSKIDLDKMLKEGEKLGLPTDIRKKMNKYIPLDKINFQSLTELNSDLIREGLMEGVKHNMKRELKKHVGKLGLEMEGFVDCVSQKDCTEWAIQNTKKMVDKHLPKSVSVALNELMEGDYEGAAIKSIAHQLKRVPELKNIDVNNLYSQLRSEDYKAAVNTIGRSQLYRFGEYRNVAERVLNGKKVPKEAIKEAMVVFLQKNGAEEVSEYLDAYGLPFYEHIKEGNIKERIESSFDRLKLSPEAIENFIKQGAGAAVYLTGDQVANELGFKSDAARKELMKGDIERAIELQMKEGPPHPANYKRMVKRVRQKVVNRTIFTRATKELFKNGSPINQEALEDFLLNQRTQ